jgi:hypothetical protein
MGRAAKVVAPFIVNTKMEAAAWHKSTIPAEALATFDPILTLVRSYPESCKYGCAQGAPILLALRL